jgi:hypothetical protein
MSTARTKQRPASGVATAVAAGALEGWVVPGIAVGIALLASTATALGLVPVPVGLAVTILGLLGLLADRGLAKLAAAGSPGVPAVAAIGLVWIVVCYFPFHVLLFPGPPLHDPILLHAADPSLPVTIATGGRPAVDLMLEGQLPPNPSGGTAIPVQYALTIEDTAAARQVVSGRFDETLRTQRLGRRGTATVVQAHHEERRLLANPAGGDVVVTGVMLEPAVGSSVTVTAFAHHLPSTPILVVLTIAVLAATVALDARLVPASEGTLTLATPAALGAALALWTSNTVHPTVSSLIGAMIFGGPLGLAVGALLWAIARRTLVHDRR